MAAIISIDAPVWDQHVIKVVRRELDKAVNSMLHAFDRAKESETQEAQEELNSKSHYSTPTRKRRQTYYMWTSHATRMSS